MPPVGFEPTISAGERPKTYDLDRAATGIGQLVLVHVVYTVCARNLFKKIHHYRRRNSIVVSNNSIASQDALSREDPGRLWCLPGLLFNGYDPRGHYPRGKVTGAHSSPRTSI